jgi:hypothetical protein
MKTLTLALIAFAVLFISCSQDESTKYENPPIIEIEGDNWIEITDKNHHIIRCVNWNDTPSSFRDSTYVIRDSNEYLELYNYRKEDSRYWDGEQWVSCDGYCLPDINFEERSLLGYGVKCSGGASFEFHIYKNDLLKKYVYYIKIINSGLYSFHMYMHWFSIPKIESGYQVYFQSE